MTDYVEEIKARLGIYEVVSQYVQLKKAGLNYKGLCPFHSEKSPSFVVSPEKQICHCFGCNKGGDIFTFIQEMEGVAFPEAMQLLADRAGVKIEKQKSAKITENKTVKDEFFKAQDLACEFFEKQLHTTNDGKKVLDYLARRGVNEGDIKEFRLGFAPESYELLTNYLLEKGISKEVLLKSGLAAQKNIGDARIYDKYRSRLIFPIFDYLGRVCGFGGRALSKDQMPKYLNSPENPIYNKSKVLYGLSHAKQAIKAQGRVVVVEGYFDMILPYQVGVQNVVATSGTALTADQVKILGRLTKEAILCFDSDDAGFEATQRAYELLVEAGFTVKVVTGLDKKDPADFVRDHGAEFGDIVSGGEDFISYLADRLMSRHDKNSFDGRRRIIDTLLPILKAVGPTGKDYFVREISRKLDISETVIYDEIANFSLPNNHPAKKGQKEEPVNVVKISLAQCLLGIFLEYPSLFKLDLENYFDSSENPNEKAIYKLLTDQYNQARGNLTTWSFDSEDLAPLKQVIQVLGLYTQERYKDFSEPGIREEVGKIIDKIDQSGKAEALKRLHRRIEEAEKNGDMTMLKDLLSQQQQLLAKK